MIPFPPSSRPDGLCSAETDSARSGWGWNKGFVKSTHKGFTDWIAERSRIHELPVTRRGEANPGVALFFGFILLWVFFTCVVAIPLIGLCDGLVIKSADDDLVLGTFAGFVAAVWATKSLMRYIENKRFADVGLHWNRSGRWNLYAGFAVGFGSALIAMLIPLAMGLGTIRTTAGSKADLRNFIFYAVIFTFQPLGEELVARGLSFQVLLRRYGFLPAILIASILFAVFHLGNPQATALSTFITFLLGVVLCCAVCRSGGLWLSTGIHAGWNITLSLFGVNLSGHALRMTRFEMAGCKDTLWCGGAYGIEGSLSALLVLAALVVGVWYLPPVAPKWLPMGGSMAPEGESM